MFLGFEFAYMAWLRKKTKFILISSSFGFIGLVMSILYYYYGGPDGLASQVREFIYFLAN